VTGGDDTTTPRHQQGCQMFNFHTKNQYLVRPWKGIVGVLYGHLDYLRPFGIFFPFWFVVPRKIWQPWSPDAGSLKNGVKFKRSLT
jgi:hypothetical protein